MDRTKRNTRRKINRRYRDLNDSYLRFDRNVADGTVFDRAPAFRTRPVQNIYKYDLVVEQWKRYSMNVGVSPIHDFISFKLSDIPGYENFANIYDFYRVKKVVVMFKTVATQLYWGNSSGDIPRVAVAMDYNDGSSTNAPAQTYQNCLVTEMTNSFCRSFSPRTAIQVYNGLTSSAYIEGKPSQWIDTLNASVPHYGLVVDIGATSIDNQFVYSLDVIFCLEFKDPRFYVSLVNLPTNSSNVERRKAHVVGRKTDVINEHEDEHRAPGGAASGATLEHVRSKSPATREPVVLRVSELYAAVPSEYLPDGVPEVAKRPP